MQEKGKKFLDNPKFLDNQRGKFSSPVSAKEVWRIQPSRMRMGGQEGSMWLRGAEERQQGAKKPRNGQGTIGNCVRESEERQLVGQAADWEPFGAVSK